MFDNKLWIGKLCQFNGIVHMKFNHRLRINKTLFVLLITVTSSAQGRYSYNDKKQGQLAISWGWNRAAYTHSNITFSGADYNFKLYDVVAHDRPTLPVTLRYLKPTDLTIPQTNFRLSYFIKNDLAITLGDDHMKYVMDQDQVVRMNGTITQDGPYKGLYDENMKMTTDFLTFEHTDGLNYINLELEKYYTWYHSKSNYLIIAGLIGGGAGILFPKTNVKLLNYERNDRFHVSGFGISGKIGVQTTFFKHILLKIEDKVGYIDMPDIILHKNGISGRAKQDFFFLEGYFTLGATFALTGTQGAKKK